MILAGMSAQQPLAAAEYSMILAQTLEPSAEQEYFL